MAVQSFRELTAWQRAMDLVTAVYAVTRQFPGDERFGLCNQVRRAAVSVPSNIAEGQARGRGHDFAHFLRIALGSLQETQTQLLIAERLGYLASCDIAPLDSLVEEVGRLIRGLQKSLALQCE